MPNKYLPKNFFLVVVFLVVLVICNYFRMNFGSTNPLGKISHLALVESNLNPVHFKRVVKDRINNGGYQKYGKYVPITGNLEQMKYFLNALKNSKNQKVRIAHYGDSLIMGDIITENLRNKFQFQFGGYGVGMLSIVADDSRMKETVTHSYSDDWTYASIVSGNREQYMLGINGTVCVPKSGSWVQYKASRVFRNVSSFEIVRLFYSNAESNSIIQYSFDDEKPISVNLEGGTQVQQLILDAKKKVTEIKIKFVSGTTPRVYGVSLESSDNGVYIDNYPLRGNSGVSLLNITSETYEQYNKYLHYNLIILNYGANVSFPNRAAYSLYEKKMEEVIERLKKVFPESSFLLVSVGDKTMKRGDQFITNPDIPFLVDLQKKIAEKTSIAYWDLREVMGGNNSMYSWVNAAPPLAFRDYVHFNSEGGKIVGNLLFEALMDLQKRQ